MATAAPFFPLNALRSAVTGVNADLAKIRGIASELNKKTTALSNRSQYNANYIVEQTAKLRSEASQQAQDYLTTARTFHTLAQIRGQESFWSVDSFLSRSMVVGDLGLQQFDSENNQLKLSKAILAQLQISNAIASLSRMPTSAVSAMADSAVERHQWAGLSSAYNELSYRSERGDETARRVANRLNAVHIPELDEATSLLHESAKIEEYIDVTLRSITTGSDDVGIRSEMYAAMEQARDKLKAEERARSLGQGRSPEELTTDRLRGLVPAA